MTFEEWYEWRRGSGEISFEDCWDAGYAEGYTVRKKLLAKLMYETQINDSVRVWRAHHGQWHAKGLEEYSFGDFLQAVQDPAPFGFLRFCDGEWNTIYQAEGESTDHHAYYPDLGQELEKIITRDPPYVIGVQPYSLRLYPRILKDYPHVTWVNADILINACLDGEIQHFFDVLRERRVLLIGPKHLGELAEKEGWDQYIIASRDCWKDYLTYRQAVPSLADRLEIDIVLFCASMMGKVLFHHMYRQNPNRNYLDVGTILEPFVRVYSRSWHSNVKKK